MLSERPTRFKEPLQPSQHTHIYSSCSARSSLALAFNHYNHWITVAVNPHWFSSGTPVLTSGFWPTLPGSPSEKHSCVPGLVLVTVFLSSCRELGASRRLLQQLIRHRHRSGHGTEAAPWTDTKPRSVSRNLIVSEILTVFLPNLLVVHRYLNAYSVFC